MLSFFIYAVGILFIWEGFKKPFFITLGIIVLSISIYASYTNKFLIPLLFLSLLFLFKDTFLDKRNRKFIVLGIISAFIIQLPNLFLITTQSFFVKSNLFYSDLLFSEYEKIKNILPFYIGMPYLFIREFLSQYFTYFSPRSPFLDPDPLPFRSIPDLSVFYPWMFIPYLIGLYITWSKRNLLNYKYLILITLIAPVPASLTKDPFWTYRAITLLLPLIIIISIGIDKLLTLRIPKLIPLFGFLVIASLALLWKGYFILLPNERAGDWEYGYQQLTQEITSNKAEHFIIDNTRRHLVHLEIAFFMKLPPYTLHNSVNPQIRDDYYNFIYNNSYYSFANIEVRSINWPKDTPKRNILVGDDLTFSKEQIDEHGLSKVFEIRDPRGKILYVGYKTKID